MPDKNAPDGVNAPAVDAGAAARGQRREQLLDAADDALRDHGPDVPMDTVAARAGVTKPILYRHFGDRNGLMVAVTRRHAERLIAELREALAGHGDPRDRIRVTIDTFLGFLERDPQLHRAAVGLGAVTSGPRHVLDDAERVLCAEVEANVREELLGARLDAAPAGTYGTAIVGMTRLVGSRWLEAPDSGREELADRLTDLLWQGLSGMAPRAGTS